MVQLGYQHGTQGLHSGSLKKIEESVCNHYLTLLLQDTIEKCTCLQQEQRWRALGIWSSLLMLSCGGREESSALSGQEEWEALEM